jgi:hypothetical protein
MFLLLLLPLLLSTIELPLYICRVVYSVRECLMLALESSSWNPRKRNRMIRCGM